MNSHPTLLRLSRYGLALLMCLAASHAWAATYSKHRSRWHITAGPSYWFRAKVSFQAGLANDPAATGKADRFYDDGFVRIDNSGNIGDGGSGPLPSRTSYFAFLADSQVDLAGGTLAMRQLQANPGYYGAPVKSGRKPAFDLTLRRSFAKEDAVRDWGLELGANFLRLTSNDETRLPATLRLLTDKFSLGGVVPQRAPYTGRFASLPGDQRIGDLPTRTVGTAAGTISGRRHFQAKTTLLRLGPWVDLRREAPPEDRNRWTVEARGGIALLCTRAEFESYETLSATNLPGTANVSGAASASRNDWGWFAGARLRKPLSEDCALSVWGDYLRGADFTLAPGGLRSVRYDTRQTFVTGLALELRFGQ